MSKKVVWTGFLISKMSCELSFVDYKPLQENCGIVAYYSPSYSEQLLQTLTAASGVQHRGQNGAGVAFQTVNGLRAHKGEGLLRDALPPSKVNELNQAPSAWTLVHCRYGTHGDYGNHNLQPCTGRFNDGTEFAVIHNGEFVGLKTQDGMSDTKVFTDILAGSEKETIEERVLDTLRNVKGAYSLAIGADNKVFLARDEFGIRPLVLGRIGEGWIAASETHALNKVGAEIIREVCPGEVLRLGTDGLSTLRQGDHNKSRFCDFEWAYFARPDSSLPPPDQPSFDPQNWLSFGLFREYCGRALAREASIRSASFVVGIPDSGVAVATGYAWESGAPHRQAILRDHYDPNGGDKRSFMQDRQMETIGRKVEGKLSLIPDSRIWKDAVVVIGDDSIVRGNVSTRITQMIFSAGAREVHWVSGFPPVLHPCHLGVSMRSREELIAARHNGDPGHIAAEIGATSVHYISPESFIRARLSSNNINVPADLNDIFLLNRGCGGCITGRYPVSRESVVL